MNIDKSPGSDGLTTDFHKKFCHCIGPFLEENLHVPLQNGELYQSQRQRAISLLHQKGKYPTVIKNLRPVSLTNADYKIPTNKLANRTEILLPKLMDEDQAGFINASYIRENICLIDNIMYKLTAKIKSRIALMTSKKSSTAWSGTI